MLRSRTSAHRRDRPGGRRRRATARTAAVVAALVAVAALPAAAGAKPISTPRQVTGVLLTEYYPVPETWFDGELITVPGLTGTHRVDWLFSARGVTMEGDGIDRHGNRVHVDQVGSAGWIGRNAKPGSYYWRAEEYWKNRKGHVTYRLSAGGWSNGVGKKHIPNKGTTFANGPSLPLKYYQSIATDPKLIPRKSRVYIPAYRDGAPDKGWMCALDTGGAIQGRHIDVYRPAPKSRDDSGYSTPGQPVYVVPPGKALPRKRPSYVPSMSFDPCSSSRR